MATDTVTAMAMAARLNRSLRSGVMQIGLPSLKSGLSGRFACVTLQTVVSLIGVMPQVARSQADAQAGVRPSISIVPRLSVSERYTDNVSLQSVGKQSELITQVSPGISISSRAGRIKGIFDYSLNELIYARNTSSRQSQNSLNTVGTIEAVDNWAFIDFSGNISQQAISAFGTQSNNASAINGNSTETSVYRLSPYFRGRLGGFADYVARYSWSTTRSGVATASDAKTKDASLTLNGATSGPLGWNADVSSQALTYSSGRPVTEDRLRGTLIYSFSPQVNVSLTGSRESNNYTTATKESHNSFGAGLNWAISESTKLAAQLDRRSFGQSHNLSFEHRTARTAWRFSDSQDVSATPVQSGTTTLGSLSDLLYGQFASVEPDPFKRTELVNRFLQDNGFRSDAKVISNFLTSSASLQRRQEASFALLGIRDTVSFSLTRGSNSQLSNFVTGLGDLSNSSVVRQTGASIVYAHRLTPDAALNVIAARQNTSGALGIQSTSLRTIDVTLSGRLGRQMNASIGARRVFFDSTTTPYTETAVTGNLSVQF